MLSPCLESQICQLIPLTFLSHLFLFSLQSCCSFCLVPFLLMAHSPGVVFFLSFFSSSFFLFFFLQKSLQICFVKLSDFCCVFGLAPAEQLASGMCCCMALVFAIMHYIFSVVLMFLSIHLLFSSSPSQPLNKSDIKKLVGRDNETMS